MSCVKIVNWASKASPTLGCSIEILRDIIIYIYVGMSVVSKMRRQKYVAHAHGQIIFWRLIPLLFISTMR